MNNYKILVIDDEIDLRKAGYVEILCGEGGGGVSVDFVGRRSEYVTLIERSSAHAYIVDVNLWETGDFQEVMNLIEKKRCPIVLVSSKWAGSGTLDLLNRLSHGQRERIALFVSWDEQWDVKSGDIIDNVARTTSANIRLALDKHYMVFTPIIHDDSDVCILHFSDMQFGDPCLSKDSFLDESRIAKALKDSKVDFLVVAGDLAYSGKPCEFNEAANFVKRLSGLLWPGKDASDKVLIVPGNHDVDLRICGAGHHDYVFGNGKNEWALKKSEFGVDYSGFQTFKQVVYDITNESECLDGGWRMSGCVERFVRCGLRFVLLNSAVSQTAANPKKCRIEVDDLRLITKCVSEANRNIDEENIFTVVVSHHGFERTNAEGFENTDEMESFLSDIQADLLLYGHGHGLDIVQRSSEPLCGLIEVMAPALSLSQRVRGDDEMRGFNVIKLKRKAGIVLDIELIPYEISKGKCRERTRDGVRKWKSRRRFVEEICK